MDHGDLAWHGCPFWGEKTSTKNPCVLSCVDFFFGPLLLGQCWAVWGPCWGHVGAMGDRVTHGWLKLVHVRLLGPCRGYVGPGRAYDVGFMLVRTRGSYLHLLFDFANLG